MADQLDLFQVKVQKKPDLLEDILKDQSLNLMNSQDIADLEALLGTPQRLTAEPIALPKTHEQDLMLAKMLIAEDTNPDLLKLLQELQEQANEEKNQEGDESKSHHKAQYILDYVDQVEKEPYQSQLVQMQESSIHRSYEVLKSQIYSFVEIGQKKMAKAIEQFLSTESRLKSIAIWGSFIALGGMKAQIILLEDEKVTRLESDNSIQASPIFCLKYSPDGQYLIAVTGQQQILLYHKHKLEKVFTNKFDGMPIAMTMLESNPKAHAVSFILADSSGLVLLTKIRRSTFTYGIETTALFKKSFGLCHQVESVKQTTLQLAALAFKDCVLVIVAEPFIEIIFKSNYAVGPRHLIQIRWQIGSEAPYLAVGFGNNLDIIQMQCNKTDKGVFTKFDKLNQYQFPQSDEITFMTWLSDNALFCKLDRNRYKVVSVAQLGGDPLIQVGLLSSFVASQGITESKIEAFHNTIASVNNSLYYIEDSNRGQQQRLVIQYQLLDWQQQIQTMIQNLDWNECLGLCLQIYKGTNLRFSGIILNEEQRTQKMKPILNGVIRKYLDKMIEVKQIENAIFIVIEFLCSIESFNFLFKEIFKIIKQHKLQKEFFQKLEPFILKNKIKLIPNDALKEVMVYLRQTRKLCTLKQLIINLDIEHLDSITVQQLCLEFNLFTPLIYISPRSDDDYKTPLFKMYAVYQQLLKDFKPKCQMLLENDNSVVNYFEAVQIDMPDSDEKIKKEIKLQGYRCLWYLSLCLKGEMFPGSTIPKLKWPNVLAELLSWFLQQDILEQFCSLDAAATLKELLHLIRNIPLYNDLAEIKSMFITQNELKDQTLAQNLIEIVKGPILRTSQKELFGLYIFEIMLQGYSVSYEQFAASCAATFKYPQKCLEDFALESSYFFLHNEPLKLDFAVELKEQKEQVIVKFVNEFSQTLKQDQDKIQDLTELALTHSFLRVMAEIYVLKGDLENAITTVLNSPDYKQFTYDYIRRGMSDHLSKESLLKFCHSITPQLVAVSPDLFIKRIIKEFNQEDFTTALEMLDNYPKEKLELLQGIIGEKRERKELVEDKLMISFFKLICEFHRSQVAEQLLIGDFPQDECLRICKQQNILDGVAILTERSGRYLDALNLYFDIVQIDLEKLLKCDPSVKSDPQMLIEWIQIHINPCIRICRSMQTEDEEAINYWFQCVLRMVKIRSEYENNDFVFRCLNQVYQIMLEEVLERVHLSAIITNSKLLLSSFSRIEELRRTFQKLLSSCSFEIHNKNQLMKVLNKGMRVIHDELYDRKCMGTHFASNCHTCYSQISQNLIGFSKCSHIYHLSCLPKQQDYYYCPECSQNNVSYRIQSQITKALHSIGKRRGFLIQEGEPSQRPAQKQQVRVEEQELPLTKEELRESKINKWKLREIDKLQAVHDQEQYKIYK